jgi:hypothetical protein
MITMTDPTPPRPVDCPTCGDEVDVFGPLEDAHFVFATRRDGSRSNLGTCPAVKGMDAAIALARTWSYDLGGYQVYYQGKLI